MKKMPAVRVRIAYGPYRVGQILYPTGLLRDQLLGRGLVELVNEASPTVVEPPKPRRRRTAANA